MQKITLNKSHWFLKLHYWLILALLITIQACKKNDHPLKDFQQVNLVANKAGYGAANTDASLVNAWGIAFGPSGIAWVNANGTGLSELYNKTGASVRPGVTIPSPESNTGGTPTGIVFNGTTDFLLPNGKPALFIFVGEDGIISGWNGGNGAVIVKNDFPDAIYKGVALANDGGANFLYAANFKERKIDVYDKNWNEVTRPFADPGLPSEYSPFNVQAIDNKLYVMYAKKVGDATDETTGPGNGYVDIYNPDGTLVSRLASRGALNAPWGITKAPAVFFDQENKTDAGVLLVGNFGDGRINAFAANGRFLGALRAHGAPIEIPGLWGLSFAPATATTVDQGWLFFAAGPNDEADGLFGYIEK
ncbi:TIGR03118 family protein [Ferruginibacter paludis]|uniref:TIGR03118 family protein n=1 Tax=Ferruginibacter paludis TaxID=1310417 RepID=UPI0025B4DB67|nr:TIGR03118 family protein [Ferruginibacter paludis]MDN3655387.1 TIGR03118 family protein [Ferruginibacter paludis]